MPEKPPKAPTGPPASPWKTGKHEEYTAFSLKVNICQDQSGFVWSEHTFATEEDEKVSMALPNGGLEQIAYALMIEMVRRELFVDSMIEIGKGEGWLDQWVQADPEERQRIEHELSNTGMKVLTQTLGQVVPQIARENMVRLATSSPRQVSEPDPSGV